MPYISLLYPQYTRYLYMPLEVRKYTPPHVAQ